MQQQIHTRLRRARGGLRPFESLPSRLRLSGTRADGLAGAARYIGAAPTDRRGRGAHSVLLWCCSRLYSESEPILLRPLLMSLAHPRLLSTCRQPFLQCFKTFPFGTSFTGHSNFLYRTSASPETLVSLVDAHSFHPWSSLRVSPRVPTTSPLERIHPRPSARYWAAKKRIACGSPAKCIDDVVRLGLRRPIRVLVGMNPNGFHPHLPGADHDERPDDRGEQARAHRDPAVCASFSGLSAICLRVIAGTLLKASLWPSR